MNKRLCFPLFILLFTGCGRQPVPENPRNDESKQPPRAELRIGDDSDQPHGKGLWVKIGGVPVDLTAGMIEAVTNPPSGFVSKHRFVETDIAARINSFNWFAHCGERLALDLTMETEQVRGWPQAMESCKAPAWDDAQLEAQNQLTLWLHLNDRASYQRWNEIVDAHKEAIVNPLSEKILVPLQAKHDLDIAFVHCVQWDILGALMGNSYLRSGHSAFFFLELLMVFEAGHFPCGWQGEWPKGKLLVY